MSDESPTLVVRWSLGDGAWRVAAHVESLSWVDGHLWTAGWRFDEETGLPVAPTTVPNEPVVAHGALWWLDLNGRRVRCDAAGAVPSAPPAFASWRYRSNSTLAVGADGSWVRCDQRYFAGQELLVAEWHGPTRQVPIRYDGLLAPYALRPDGAAIVGARGPDLICVDSNGRERVLLLGNAPFESVVWPDADTVVALSQSELLVAVNPESAAVRWRQHGPQRATLAAHEDTLCAWQPQGSEARCYDLATGEERFRLKIPEPPYLSHATPSPDLRRIAVAQGSQIAVRSLEDGRVLRANDDPWVFCLAARGGLLALGMNGRVVVRSTRDGSEVWSFEVVGEVDGLGFHPHGELFASAGTRTKPSGLYRFDLTTGMEISYRAGVGALRAVDPEGEWLLLSTGALLPREGTRARWRKEFRRTVNEPWPMRWSPDRSLLVVEDLRALRVEAQSGAKEVLCKTPGRRRMVDAALLDGDALVALGEQQLWRWSAQKPGDTLRFLWRPTEPSKPCAGPLSVSPSLRRLAFRQGDAVRVVGVEGAMVGIFDLGASGDAPHQWSFADDETLCVLSARGRVFALDLSA